jgi:thiamine biosynthesis lipoprotein
MKHIILFSYFLIFNCVLLIGCKENKIEAELTQKLEYAKISGKTMGTTYNMTYQFIENGNLKQEIDSILIDFNKSLSTYDSTSTISKFNLSNGKFCFDTKSDKYLLNSLTRALEIAKETNGFFDPTVNPLVNYWGFGYKPKDKSLKPSKSVIDSLLKNVGYKKIGLLTKNDTCCIIRESPNVQIDLSASAKGHGVDVIGDYLYQLGIENYMVEIGGEIAVRGNNPEGKPWVIGINKPTIGAALEEVQIPIILKNQAMATSGNYRNYYESNEITYAHIINPITGYSSPSDILSATVVADDCLTADAFATACMVLGLEKSIKLINSNPKLQAIFIYSNQDKSNFKYYYSEGLLNAIDTSFIK